MCIYLQHHLVFFRLFLSAKNTLQWNNKIRQYFEIDIYILK